VQNQVDDSEGEWILIDLDGEEVTVEANVPSGEIKLVHPFTVVEGETLTLTLDFDALKSVIFTDYGAVNVQPVIKLVTD
jgi:hypothetical protein